MKWIHLVYFLAATWCVDATSRTTPPAGAVIVTPTPASGQFSSLQSAVNSLPDTSSPQTIFIYPGTYEEQVIISRSAPLTIMGYTTNTATYTENTVLITQSKSLGQTTSDDATATISIHQSNFAMYNVNASNTFGKASSNGQALALSAYGNNMGFYGVAIFSYQDTLLADTGTQFFGKSYIQGAVDFIFGQTARLFIQGSVIASIGPGCITADGRDSSTNPSLFVINESDVILGPNAASGTSGNVFLGRPWRDWASVVFSQNTLGSQINPAGWSPWNSTDPNTDHVLFGEFDNTGPGAAGTRANFSTKLTSDSAYTAAAVLGSNWTTWVDQSYV